MRHYAYLVFAAALCAVACEPPAGEEDASYESSAVDQTVDATHGECGVADANASSDNAYHADDSASGAEQDSATGSAPKFEEILVEPSGSTVVCSSVLIFVEASDPNQAKIFFSWHVFGPLLAQNPATYRLIVSDDQPGSAVAVFTSKVVGKFTIMVTVSNQNGLLSSQPVTIHVADTENPPACGF